MKLALGHTAVIIVIGSWVQIFRLYHRAWLRFSYRKWSFVHCSIFWKTKQPCHVYGIRKYCDVIIIIIIREAIGYGDHWQISVPISENGLIHMVGFHKACRAGIHREPPWNSKGNLNLEVEETLVRVPLNYLDSMVQPNGINEKKSQWIKY